MEAGVLPPRCPVADQLVIVMHLGLSAGIHECLPSKARGTENLTSVIKNK